MTERVIQSTSFVIQSVSSVIQSEAMNLFLVLFRAGFLTGLLVWVCNFVDCMRPVVLVPVTERGAVCLGEVGMLLASPVPFSQSC